MGILDSLKSKVFGNQKKDNEGLTDNLSNAKTNLKAAYDYIGKFLDGTRDFQPANRHQALYNTEVKQRLVSMRNAMRNGLTFLDERLRHEINTKNPIIGPNQLKQLIDEWIKTLNSNDEKVYDIMRILTVEIWDDEKAKRGFPMPMNKELVCSYLTKVVDHLRNARGSLDNYVSLTNVPETNEE